MKNCTKTMRTMGVVPALGILLSLSCLPEDTRPEPATIYTDFALAPHDDTDLGDGLSFVTDDGYEVTFSQILLTLGRITFRGKGCNAYSIQDQGGFYSRVMDALQPGTQRVGTSWAVGECSLGFQMVPPEDWAHVDNPGVSEADRDSLRAVEFPNQGMVDEFSGPRGTKGVSLRVVGQGKKLDSNEEPTKFYFDFPTETPSPLCSPEGEEFYELQGGQELHPVIEMSPEMLFGTCGDSTELRFAPIAAAEPAREGEPITLKELEPLDTRDFSGDGAQQFYSCSQGGEAEGAESAINTENASVVLNLRGWLGFRAAIGLFGVRDAQCRKDPDPGLR